MLISSISLTSAEIKSCKIRFQVYDSGKIPDAEIIIGSTIRILIESKIRANTITYPQLEEYSKRLVASAVNYPQYYLVVLTQTDQKGVVVGFASQLEKQKVVLAKNIIASQWRDAIACFKIQAMNSKDKVLKYLMEMFNEEIEKTMYNRIDIATKTVQELNEVVLTTQKDIFVNMALEDNVFWPYANFSPSQYVGYYFTKNCPNFGGTLSHIAKVKYIWHNVTIDEVLTSIDEFKDLPDFQRFHSRATKLYPIGSTTQFAIAITENPIELKNSIPYIHRKGKKLNPVILPGRKTTLAKLFTSNEIEDLY